MVMSLSEQGSEKDDGNLIEKRKEDHIRLAISENVLASYNFWDDVILEHNALPEIDYDEIKLETKFLGKNIGAPIMITGITGGFKKAKEINDYLAKIAEKYRIPMGVGSQRPILTRKDLIDTYLPVKEYDIPVRIGNIGAPQLRVLSVDEIKYLVEVIDAHAIAVHLNYLQEVVQPEGDKEASGVLEKIKEVKKELNIPIIVKETGAGISKRVALSLIKAGVNAIDSSGVSGTSFSAIEYYRALQANNVKKVNLGKILWDWGIPAPLAVLECRRAIKASRRKVYLIGSGGIRTGLDVARAIVLGADIAGMARRALEMYFNKEDLGIVIEELKSVMFLTGSKNVEDLRKVRYWIVGRLKDFIR